MQILDINFFSNWNNKLNNRYFTKIIPHTNSKYDYYAAKRGRVFQVHINDIDICQAELSEVMAFCLRENNTEDENLLLDILFTLETGLSLYDARNIIRNKGVKDYFIVLLFKKIIDTKQFCDIITVD